MTTTELSPEAKVRQAAHEATVAENRDWLDNSGPPPTATELVRPIIEALLPLHDFRERVESHVEILERHEFVNVTDDDWRAARELLALQHEIADLLALELSGWANGGQRWSLGAAFRAVLYEAMDTAALVYGCRHAQLDKMR